MNNTTSKEKKTWIQLELETDPEKKTVRTALLVDLYVLLVY